MACTIENESGADSDDSARAGDDGKGAAGKPGQGGRGSTPEGGAGGVGEGGAGDGPLGGRANPDGPGEGGAGGEPNEPDEPNEPNEPSTESSRFFLPMSEPTNTSAPTVEVDRKGGVHAVYPRYAGGSAFYGYCSKDCSDSDAFAVVEFPTDGTVHNAMIALDGQGRPRVLLSTMTKVYFASCDSGCTTADAWTLQEVLAHEGDKEVSGEAFALDPEGRPHFLMHTYRAFLGIGQKPRKTWHVSCESDCEDPASWTSTQIATQTWEGTHLRFDAEGRAHAATVANVEEDGVVTNKLGAYAICEADCHVDTNWVGTGLYKAYEHNTEAVTMYPTVTLALTRAGTPRVVVLGSDDAGNRNIVYFECEENCTGNGWIGSIISNHERIGAGLDLALDSTDHPRLAYTLDYNIALAYCDAADCTSENAKWDLTKVEFGADLPKDDIFLWDNCTVGAWFLHDPSLAIGVNGEPRVGYQARDVSGGFSQPDPTKPACVAGTDMTWSRLAVLSSHR